MPQPTRVSDLLSHSRGRQRAEPTLEGLATSSGRPIRCFLRMQPYVHVWVASCFRPLSVQQGMAVPPEPEPSQTRLEDRHLLRTLAQMRWNPLILLPSHGAHSFICRKEVQGESQMGIQTDSSTYEFRNLHVLLPHLCLTSSLSNRARS